MAYNLSWMENTTTLGGIVSNVNVMANDLLFVFLLFLVFVAFYAYSDNSIDGYIAMFFALSIVSLLIWLAGFISWGIAIIPFVMLIASMLVKFFK